MEESAPLPPLLNDCQWPPLSGHYEDALCAVVRYILENYDVHGIVVSGSIIRGNPNKGSDFDTVVIHAQPERQRVQKFFCDVPTELFVNPPATIRSYFESERKAARPSTAHMLATGFVILQRDPVVQALVQEAKEELVKRPDPSAQALTFKRYGAVDLYENAVDIAQTNPANASLILHDAVRAMIEYHFLETNQWLPRLKEMLTGLARSNQALGALGVRFYQESNLAVKLQIAEQLAQQILGETGFFEWESTREEFTQ